MVLMVHFFPLTVNPYLVYIQYKSLVGPPIQIKLANLLFNSQISLLGFMYSLLGVI